MRSTFGPESIASDSSIMTMTAPTASLFSTTPNSLVRDVINYSKWPIPGDWFFWAGNRLDAFSTNIGGMLVCERLVIPTQVPEVLQYGWLRDDRIKDSIIYEHPRPPDEKAFEYYSNQRPGHQNITEILERDYRHRIRAQFKPTDDSSSRHIKSYVKEHLRSAMADIELTSLYGPPLLQTQLESPLVLSYRLENAGESPSSLKPVELIVNSWEAHCRRHNLGIGHSIKGRYIFLVLALLGVDRFEDLIDYSVDLRESGSVKLYRQFESHGSYTQKNSMPSENTNEALRDAVRDATINAIEISADWDAGVELDLGFKTQTAIASNLMTRVITKLRRPSKKVKSGFLETLSAALRDSGPMEELFQRHLNLEAREAGRLVGVLNRIARGGERLLA